MSTKDPKKKKKDKFWKIKETHCMSNQLNTVSKIDLKPTFLANYVKLREQKSSRSKRKKVVM